MNSGVKLDASAPAEKYEREVFVFFALAVLKYTESRNVRTQVNQVPRLHCMNLGSEVQ